MLLQIMLRLQQKDRPEIPPLHTLPGQPLPGIDDYVKLMTVCQHSVCKCCHHITCTHVAHATTSQAIKSIMHIFLSYQVKHLDYLASRLSLPFSICQSIHQSIRAFIYLVCWHCHTRSAPHPL